MLLFPISREGNSRFPLADAHVNDAYCKYIQTKETIGNCTEAPLFFSEGIKTQ